VQIFILLYISFYILWYIVAVVWQIKRITGNQPW